MFCFFLCVRIAVVVFFYCPFRNVIIVLQWRRAIQEHCTVGLEMLDGSLGKSLLGHSACSAQPQRSRLSISAAFTLVLFKHIDVGGLFSILTVLIADFSF